MAIRFNPEDLKEAALERIALARSLYTSSDADAETKYYSAAIYFAGVAVECILRGYRLRTDPQFDSRHDLVHLLKRSGFVNFVPDARKQEVSAALGEIWARWKNEYRYASDRRLLADLKDRGLTHRIKGDQLKENARVAIESAYELINVGVKRWSND